MAQSEEVEMKDSFKRVNTNKNATIMPGKNPTYFKVVFEEDWLVPNDFLHTPEKITFRILEVYKTTCWKKFLRWLGFKIPNYRVEKLNFK